MNKISLCDEVDILLIQDGRMKILNNIMGFIEKDLYICLRRGTDHGMALMKVIMLLRERLNEG